MDFLLVFIIPKKQAKLQVDKKKVGNSCIGIIKLNARFLQFYCNDYYVLKY